MRFLFAPLFVLLAFAVPASAADVKLRRVWPEWFDADTFESFYENHTGRELTGKWTILRSSPKDRGGIYFMTRVENAGAKLPGATFVLSVIAPDSVETRVFTFKTTIEAGSHLIELALTGKDWAFARTEPVAWKLELRAADGSVVTDAKSFLWEKPEH